MNNIEKYYSNTKNAKPNYTVKRFIELKIKPGNAIEIGCGAGRDTVYLIKNGWKVLAIDNNVLIAQWILKQNNQDFDGIYEIKFNDDLECIYFKSWKMVK